MDYQKSFSFFSSHTLNLIMPKRKRSENKEKEEQQEKEKEKDKDEQEKDEQDKEKDDQEIELQSKINDILLPLEQERKFLVVYNLLLKVHQQWANRHPKDVSVNEFVTRSTTEYWEVIVKILQDVPPQSLRIPNSREMVHCIETFCILQACAFTYSVIFDCTHLIDRFVQNEEFKEALLLFRKPALFLWCQWWTTTSQYAPYSQYFFQRDSKGNLFWEQFLDGYLRGQKTATPIDVTESMIMKDPFINEPLADGSTIFSQIDRADTNDVLARMLLTRKDIDITARTLEHKFKKESIHSLLQSHYKQRCSVYKNLLHLLCDSFLNPTALQDIVLNYVL